MEATQKVGKCTQDLLGRGSGHRTADFVESKAGALKPKHCETDVADSVSERERRRRRRSPRGAEEISFGRTQSGTTQHLMLGTRHWAGAFVTQGWKVHFLTRGPTGKMYLPPGYIPAKSGWDRHFLWEGGSIWRGFWAGLHTMSPWAVFIPRALVYSSQGGPRHRSTFNGRPLWTATPTDRSTI